MKKHEQSEVKSLVNNTKRWKNLRLDWVASFVRGNTGLKKDELLNNGEYVALQYGKTYKVEVIDESFTFFVNSEFFKKSQVVNQGDTILISTSETIQDLGHSCFYNRNDLGLLGGEQILLKPNKKITIEKYLYYYSRYFCKEFKKYATGLKVFRYNIDDLKKIFIEIPSLEEQTAIVKYLDNKNQAIEKKINLLSQKVNYYKEYRKSLIKEVVCNGLDRNLKLKDSGISWIGEIPDHWKIKRGKDLFIEFSKSKITANEGNKKGKYKFFTSSNEQTKWLDYFEINEEAILLSTGGRAGVNYCEKEFSYSTDCWAIKGNKKIYLKYYYYYFENILEVIQQRGFKGSSLEHLQKDFIKQEEIILPNIEEQIQISNYLDKKTTTIDNIVSNLKTQIKILKELRKTLINDVVTGKIKVTN